MGWVLDPGGALSQRNAALRCGIPPAAPQVRPALARLANRALPDGGLGAAGAPSTGGTLEGCTGASGLGLALISVPKVTVGNAENQRA